ncbi:MAG: hypothetical protein Q8M73_09970 [Actinomycetota bacterium]|nr:hypothetical protein [Actinomycetota bacterium]
MRRTVSLLVCAGLALLSVPSGNAWAADAVVASGDRLPVSVPIRTIDTPDRTGQNGIVSIRVGSSSPMSVMLDTGSVGLRLWDGKPAGAVATSVTAPSSAGGAPLPGQYAKAAISIGGVRTSTAVPFQLISTDSNYIKQWKSKGIAGILGIGVSRGPLPNPLTALPGSLGTRWSVHFARSRSGVVDRSGALVLGARAPGSAIMNFQLSPQGQSSAGVLLWDDHAASGCWTFGSLVEQCVPTWFDSGFTVMRIKGKSFASLPSVAGDLLRPGTVVTLAAGSSAYVAHRFVAGHLGSRNLARVLGSGRSVINTGNSFYFDYTVSYDIALGKLALSASEKGN